MMHILFYYTSISRHATPGSKSTWEGRVRKPGLANTKGLGKRKKNYVIVKVLLFGDPPFDFIHLELRQRVLKVKGKH